MTPAHRVRIPNHLHVAGSLPERQPWYSISNTADVASIYVYNEIGGFGITADDFLQDLGALNQAQIDVRINCKGGDVFDGIAIYNALRQHDARVVTKIDSLAASIASVIAQAGDERIMVQHSQMMIHDAHGVCVGGAADMTAMGVLLERQSNLIADIYATKARSADIERYRDLMRAETWLTADEAVELGLADRVVAPADMTNEIVNQSPGEPDEAPTAQTDWVSVFASAITDPLEALT